jgi:alpha-1,3-glucosyltransferase
MSPLSPFAILPPVTPAISALCVALSMVGSLTWLWLRKHSMQLDVVFLTMTAASYFAGFMFGWHVHEKAILVPLLVFG